MNKNITFLFTFLICISFASALFERTVEVTDLKQDAISRGIEISESAMKYPAVEVVGFWDGVLWIEDKKADLVLTDNTETCGQNCMAEFQVCTAGESALVEDVVFDRLSEDNKTWISGNVRSYQFYIKTNEEEFKVDDYETQCKDGEWNEKNQTYDQVCNEVVVGSHIEKRPLYEPYSIGEVKPADCYTVKLEAEKRPDWTYDWKIKTQGKLISEWAIWNAGSEINGLKAYYKLDETSGSIIIDSLNLNNGTNVDATIGDSGKINNSYSYNGLVKSNLPNSIIPFGTNEMSFNVWAKFSNSTSNQAILMSDTGAGVGFGLYLSSGSLHFNRLGGTDTTYTWTPTTNQWYMVTTTLNSTGTYIYINNALVKNSTVNTVISNSSQPIGLGAYRSGASYTAGWGFNGSLDEVGIWNKSLTVSEINSIYSSGNGLTYPFVQGVVTLNSPADNSISTTTSVTTNATATITGGAYLTNATLYDNSTGTWGARNTTVIAGTEENATNSGANAVNTDYNVTVNILKAGYFNRIGYSKDSTSSSTYQITIFQGGSIKAQKSTTSSVQEDSVSFVSGDYSSILSTGSAIINYKRTAGTANNVRRTTGQDFTGIGFSYTSQQTPSSISLPLYSYTYYNTSATQTFTNTYASSPIKWNYQFCDSDGSCGFATSNRTFSIDSVAPTITLNYPTSIVNYGAVNGTLQLNLTTTDNNLANVWYNYNGTNVSIAGALSGVANLSNITLSSKKNVTIYANDTAGNLNTTTFAWDYYVFETGQEYTSSVAEGTSSIYSVNFSMSPTYRLSTASLIYNGTATSGTVIEVSNNTYVLSATKIAPSVAADTNYTFYWQLVFENSQTINTSSNTQTVINIAIDNCGSYTNKLFNFTMVDEDTQLKLNQATENTQIRVDMQFKNPQTLATIINYSARYNQTNPALICSGASIANSTFRVDALIEYSSNGRFVEFYNIQNYTLNTATTNQNITLYDLNSTGGGQTFKINYKDQYFNSQPGSLIQLKRKYVDEGVYKVIEIPMISSAGYATAHLIPVNNIYSMTMIKDGNIIDTIEDIIAYCPNPSFTDCVINLNSYGSAIVPGSFDNQGDFSSTLTYSKSTRTITSTFTIPSGGVSTVVLNATKADAIGTTIACSDSLTASSGTLTCTIPNTIGNTTIKVYLTADGEVKKWFVMSLGDSPSQLFGTNLVFLAVVMLLFFIGISVQQDPKIMGITLILGVIVMGALNLITSASWIGKGATVLWFVVAIILILIKSGNKR